MEEEKKKIIKNEISKGGRPKKSDEEKKRHRFSAYFSDEQAKLVKQKMSNLGYLEFSTLCFDLLILEKIKVEKNVVLPVEIKGLMNKIGANIYQLVKSSNLNNAFDPIYVSESLDKILQNQQELVGLLKKNIDLIEIKSNDN